MSPAPTRRDILLAAGLAAATTTPRPALATLPTVSSPKGYAITPPPAWTRKDKAGADAFWTAPAVAYASLGVTATPVRLARLADFGTVGAVADKLLAAERAKDGFISATLLVATARPGGASGDPLYAFEYDLVTTRIHKIVLSTVGVRDGTLLIANGQTPCGPGGGSCAVGAPALSDLRAAMESFAVV